MNGKSRERVQDLSGAAAMIVVVLIHREPNDGEAGAAGKGLGQSSLFRRRACTDIVAIFVRGIARRIHKILQHDPSRP